MPDYQFNTNLGPAAQQGTSLGDLINTARGAQAYQQAQELNPLAIERSRLELQQAQQMNPLALQQKRMEIEQANKMNPQAVRTATAQAGSAELNLSSAQTEKLYGLAGGVLNDPRLKSKDPHEVMGALYEAKQRASTYGIPKEAVDGVFSPLFETAQKKPDAVKQALNNIVQSRLPAESQTALQVGGTVEINGVKYQYAPASGKLEPLGATPAPAAPGMPAAPTKPTSGLVPLDMPVSGAVPQLNTQQQERYGYGKKLLDTSAEMAQTAGEGRQTIRQIKQNIGEAAGSKPEQILRNAKRWVAGNEQLDELVKSLADNQLRQSQMMGVNTDAARSTASLASGSENITAGALNMIANRADAVNTAFEKFNDGLSKFKQKNGQYNGAIHADNFQQAWKQNYDPLVFMVQNINASDMSKAEKQLELSKILKGLSDEQRQALAKKAENIKRLEKGDF
jgi:hypothetical protein